MKKITVLLIACLFLTGCGNVAQGVASIKGHSTHCIDGVEYIQFRNGATVKYLPSGEISTC